MDPIDKLLEGFQRFREKYFHKEPELFERLATRGQAPKVAVVACCDSRVDPAIVTDCSPGDLFTIRNVANLVPPHEPEGQYHGTSAAIEFAVRGLGVEHIVVLGHAQCGGIGALMEGAYSNAAQNDFITAWMGIARKARDTVLADPALQTREAQTRACEQAAIHVSLSNLMTFPWIRERVEEGKLRLHGWYFDLESGELSLLDQQQSGTGTRG
jgi:carbonic anhydrase